jgi:putative transposase
VPEHGIRSATFYKWRANYGGMDTSLMSRMKAFEAENRRLKKRYAEDVNVKGFGWNHKRV